MAKSSPHFPISVSVTVFPLKFVAAWMLWPSMEQASPIGNFEAKDLTDPGRDVANPAFCHALIGEIDGDLALAFAGGPSGRGETSAGVRKHCPASAEVKCRVGRGWCIHLKCVGRMGARPQQEK